jgi:hypothetical protein
MGIQVVIIYAADGMDKHYLMMLMIVLVAHIQEHVIQIINFLSTVNQAGGNKLLTMASHQILVILSQK